MRILMIAPEPCFASRGTPLSVFARCRALIDLGHRVDLLTYPVGPDVAMEGLRIVRTSRPPFVRRVKAGPSLLKLCLDVLVFFKARRLTRTGDYHCIHTHEEASVIGALLARRYGCAHVYDMHSSIPQQFSNYGWRLAGIPARIARRAERWVLARTDMVICVCQELAARVGDAAPTAVIHNAPVLPPAAAATSDAGDGALPDDPPGPVALYMGNLGRNQGMDLLARSIPIVAQRRPDVRFVVAGGSRKEIASLSRRMRRLGVRDSVSFIGEVPAEAAAGILERADVLLSPRLRGGNVPLKTYHYLRAARPIVATGIPAHTQVLDTETAVLTGPDPSSFADGILRVLDDDGYAETLAANAGKRAETAYSYESYLDNVREAYRLCHASCRRGRRAQLRCK